MARFFGFWNKGQIRAPRREENVSKFLQDTNEKFKIFLTSCSWLVYVTAGLLILCCIYYYFYDWKRRLDLRQRRRDMQHTSERIPQRRRPGAAFRDHEIFRNVMKAVRQYIPRNVHNTPAKSFVVRRTRSGAIYGRFGDPGTD